MGLFGAKDMSGYGPAGRGAIIPRFAPRFSGAKTVCTKVFGAFLRFLNEKTAYTLKTFPAARANWLRNPIRKRHIYI